MATRRKPIGPTDRGAFRGRFESLERRALLAGDLHVVGPGESIQAAIDAAAPGDTVAIARGVYHEDLFIDKELELKGLSPRAEDVVITPGPDDSANGIWVVGNLPSVVIANLRVSGWFGNGIVVGDGSGDGAFFTDRTAIHNVIVDSNGSDGINLNDGIRAHITYVHAHDNGDDGIDAKRLMDSLHLKHSRLEGNGGNGAEVLDTHNLVKLVGVTARRNFDDGVLVGSRSLAETPDVVVWAGRFSYNGKLPSGELGSGSADGLELTDLGSLTATGVLANGNQQDGLFVVGVAGDASIQGGVFNGNGHLENNQTFFIGNGIELINVAADVSLAAVRASHNVANGLLVLNAGDVDLFFSAFGQNGFSGIVMGEVGDVEVKLVRASNNGSDGLFIQFAGDVSLKYSAFNFNGGDGLDLIDIGVLTEIGVVEVGNGKS